jgi:hypothetical protein
MKAEVIIDITDMKLPGRLLPYLMFPEVLVAL